MYRAKWKEGPIFFINEFHFAHIIIIIMRITTRVLHSIRRAFNQLPTDYRLLGCAESQPPESPSGCWVFEGGELVSLMNNATITTYVAYTEALRSLSGPFDFKTLVALRKR